MPHMNFGERHSGHIIHQSKRDSRLEKSELGEKKKNLVFISVYQVLFQSPETMEYTFDGGNLTNIPLSFNPGKKGHKAQNST